MRSLVFKLWLALTGLILLVMIPLEIGLHRLQADFYATQVTEPLLYHSNHLAHLLAADPGAIALAPAMGRMVGGEVLLVDADGLPVAFPGASSYPPPRTAATAALSGAAFAGQVNLGNAGTFIVTAVPIPGGGGAVLLLAPAEPLQRSLALARRYLWLAGTGTVALGTLLALLLARSLLQPLLAIERATRSIARGDFSTRVQAGARDETGRLAEAVNSMTAQLQAYENRRREFLANVAHELRTPLSYIRGYTQAIAEGLVTNPEEQVRYQRIVHEESLRIGRLVDDLMDLAQMEEGQLGLTPAPLDLRIPAEQAASLIRPQAEERGVQVEIQIPDGLPQPEADGGRIQQAIFNLLDNGLRHSERGGQLTVSAEAGPEWLTVRVTDTGQGIEPEALPLIFERFQRRHSTGRGLGLSIVRSIVRAHGGEVGVESQPGEGSTFWFRLPIRV